MYLYNQRAVSHKGSETSKAVIRKLLCDSRWLSLGSKIHCLASQIKLPHLIMYTMLFTTVHVTSILILSN